MEPVWLKYLFLLFKLNSRESVSRPYVFLRGFARPLVTEERPQKMETLMPRLLTSTALLALIAVPHMAQAASWGKQYLKDAACRINRKTLPNGNFEIYASPFAGKSVDLNSRNRVRNLLGQGPVTFSVNPNGPYDRNGVLIVKSRDNQIGRAHV